MTNFGWWADQMPEGTFLCCICFNGKPAEEAWVDGQGNRWDICLACDAVEKLALAKREEERDVRRLHCSGSGGHPLQPELGSE